MSTEQSWPWSVLGIEPESTEREIRRAYASRLKAIKKDLDAHDFQALREAYEYALAQADTTPAPPRPAAFSVSSLEPVEMVRPTMRAVPRVPIPLPEPAGVPDLEYEYTPDAEQEPARADGVPRVHWRDIAAELNARAPHIDTRERDRERIAALLDGIDAALGAGNEQSARNQFEQGVRSLAHPADGVSLGALISFERSLVARLREQRARGVEAHAFFRDVARHFNWAQRAQDVLSASDPMAEVIRDFGLADAIWRCARNPAEPGSLVHAAFALDLVNPVDPILFARRLLTEESLTRRRNKWRELEQHNPGIFQWLPSVNVEWWRRALTGPRVLWYPAAFANFIATGVTGLYLLALAGLGMGTALVTATVWAAVAGPFILFLAAMLQDRPRFQFIRHLAAKVSVPHRWFSRHLTWPGNTQFTLGRLFYVPLLETAIFGFITLTAVDELQQPGKILEMGKVLVVIWMVTAILTLAYLGVRVMHALFMQKYPARRNANDPLHSLFWVAVAVLGFLLLMLIFALGSADSATDAAILLGEVLAGIAACCGAVYGAIRLDARLPKRWRIPYYLVIALVIVPVVVATMMKLKGGLKFVDSYVGVVQFVMIIAAIIGTTALLLKAGNVAKEWSAHFFRWMDRAVLSRFAPGLHKRGLRLMHIVWGVPVAAGITLFFGSGQRLANDGLGVEDAITFVILYLIAVVVLVKNYPRD